MACTASTRVRYPYLAKYISLINMTPVLLHNETHVTYIIKIFYVDIVILYTLVNKYTQPSCSESTYMLIHFQPWLWFSQVIVVRHFLRALVHLFLPLATFALPQIPGTCITDVPAPLNQSSAANQPCLGLYVGNGPAYDCIIESLPGMS